MCAAGLLLFVRFLTSHASLVSLAQVQYITAAEGVCKKHVKHHPGKAADRTPGRLGGLTRERRSPGGMVLSQYCKLPSRRDVASEVSVSTSTLFAPHIANCTTPTTTPCTSQRLATWPHLLLAFGNATRSLSNIMASRKDMRREDLSKAY